MGAWNLTNLNGKAPHHCIELSDSFKHVDDLLGMSKEELGCFLLKRLIKCEPPSNSTQPALGRHYIKYHHPDIAHYGLQAEKTKKVVQKLEETWQWLVNQQYIAHPPDGNYYIRITDNGHKAASKAGEPCWDIINRYPWDFLHPIIRDKAKSMFLGNHFPQAVQCVFTKVESCVRKVQPLCQEDGIKLIREAFHKTSGALTIQTDRDPEKDAAAHLFAGAYGLYRNKGAHNSLELAAEEALRQIELASLLLYEIEKRIKTKEEN